MKKITPLLFVSFLFNSVPVLGEQSVEVLMDYWRGDDDKKYVYSTADLDVALRLKKVASGFDAQVSFTAKLTTEETQGLLESVRFGMREAERFSTAIGESEAKKVAVSPQMVLFKFTDAAIQQTAEALSNQALQAGSGIGGNTPQAKGKTLGGTLRLGVLSEGEHRGTIYVQQMVGQTPSAADTDISVRHLIEWHAKVQDGRVYVEVQNGKYFDSDVSIKIAAPSWDGPDQPHRVNLESDQIVIDGRSFPSGRAQYGVPFEEKGATLLQLDKQEFRQEFNGRERREIRRANKR